jgi:hypothetical protein
MELNKGLVIPDRIGLSTVYRRPEVPLAQLSSSLLNEFVQVRCYCYLNRAAANKIGHGKVPFVGLSSKWLPIYQYPDEVVFETALPVEVGGELA